MVLFDLMYFRTPLHPDNKEHEEESEGLSAPLSVDIPMIYFYLAQTVKGKGNRNTLSRHLRKQRLNAAVEINSVCYILVVLLDQR